MDLISSTLNISNPFQHARVSYARRSIRNMVQLFYSCIACLPLKCALPLSPLLGMWWMWSYPSTCRCRWRFNFSKPRCVYTQHLGHLENNSHPLAAEEDDTDPSDQASSPNVVNVEDSEVAALPPSPVNVPPPVDVNSPVGAITIGRPPQVVIPSMLLIFLVCRDSSTLRM